MVATQINVINTWERATSSVLLLRESIGARVELLVDAGTDKDSVSLDDRVAVRALHEDLKRLLTSMEAASVDLLQLSIEEASLEDLTTNAAESAKLFQHLHEVEQVDIADKVIVLIE